MTSTAKTASRREAIIMVLLVVVGTVLAFVLFAAGALWRGRTSAERPKTSVSTPAEKTGAEPKNNTG
jgi:flagellar basal body-associated protein FliL